MHAAIDYWSRTYGVDAHLVRAVALWESGFNNSLVSTAGARGVMQVTPATWDYVETVLVGRRIPRTTSGNVQVGVTFLDRLLSEFAETSGSPWPRTSRARGCQFTGTACSGDPALRRRSTRAQPQALGRDHDFRLRVALAEVGERDRRLA